MAMGSAASIDQDSKGCRSWPDLGSLNAAAADIAATIRHQAMMTDFAYGKLGFPVWRMRFDPTSFSFRWLSRWRHLSFVELPVLFRLDLAAISFG